MKEDLTVSSLLKSYYSIGAMVYSIALPSIAGGLWWLGNYFKPDWFKFDVAGLFVSILCTYSVALLVPEPTGFPGEGSLKLTPKEAVTSIFGGLLTFATVLGARCLATGHIGH